MPKTKTGKERTAKYDAKQNESGLVRIAIWIPLASKFEFMRLAALKRKELKGD